MGPATGRARGGTSDDSIGRARGGTSDDSIGRARGGTPDDSIGRNRGGTPDDSIGRTRGGTPDDSIGLGGYRNAAASRYGSSYSSGVMVKGQLIGGPAPTRANTVRGNPLAGALGLGYVTANSKDLRKATNGLDKSTVRSAQSLMASDAAARKVLASADFRALPRTDRSAVIQVMVKGGETAASGMSRLFSSGKAGVLQQADANGTTVLANLGTLARSAHPNVAGDVLSDIANPRRIQQGYAPTCTTTSMQYELAKEHPAEYARLLTGLTTTGSVQMAGGGTLSVDANKAVKVSDKLADYRTDAEAIFQTAAMDFGNGADRYNYDKQRSEGARGTYKGLFPDEIRTMTSQLFGANYAAHEIHSDAEAAQVLSQLDTLARPNRPVLFDISMGSFNHCVALESADAERVRYRDPSTGDVATMKRGEFVKKLTAVYSAD